MFTVPSPETPCLYLKLKLMPLLSCILCRAAEDSELRPFIFKWSPLDKRYYQNAFLLLRYTTSGALEEVPVPDVVEETGKLQGAADIRDPFDITELKPGGSVLFYQGLPDWYRQQLVPGDKYKLLWLGAKLPLWNWGTLSDNLEARLCPDLARPDLIIPGDVSITFTYEEIETPASTPPPILPSVQVAPVLSVELMGPSTVSREHDALLHLLVRYHGNSTNRPIIFYNHMLLANLHHYRLKKDQWELWDRGCPGILLDGPDVTVNVTQDWNFVFLKPGEFWTFSSTILDDINYWTIGDTFRYQFTGGTIEWLEGGVRQDNGSRPDIVIPASNAVEFRITE
ncbi:hypothetical protein BDV38DRAFT_269201 [Aspergillus pseudotamarii]|uniref:Uncharacterized protein n=1 Tax=Aspergillus pseudotamarii TaxID=132259 RepID=A0A5N6T1F3_ASPPS|nr:uncharacterized protein BDV38DRAFT_269201 [Aspergillus pseudotamarii]KAE8140181.1 hypothetical protein BDV38DRAFT_269201 [Aspergillus pseudotamarii]